MANVLKKIFVPSVDQISQTYTIESWHVSQSVDAFTGIVAYDIYLSGSMNITGSLTNGSADNVASGLNSHAEGKGNTASGLASHAEGFGTQATAQGSHAEGEGTLASGLYSHAEGADTVSSGEAAHSEGVGTIAAGNYQTVVGSYNISKNDPTAFIIGKGTGDGSRANLLLASGSRFEISGAVFLPEITTTSQNSVVTINASTGQLYYTASSAFGGGGGSTNTGSLLTTASVNLNTITFTKGDGSTFPITVNTGSGGGSTNTGSLLTTASISTNVITFTKGDGSTFPITIVSSSYAVTASHAVSASNISNAVANNINDYILTATGGATINGEANLRFDGSSLKLTGSAAISSSLAVGNIAPSATVGRIDASNDIVAYSTSDERLKYNIVPISNPISKIEAIGGYTFDWKPEHKDLHGFEGHDVGVIAQEIESILPEIVTTRDTGYKAVKYEKIVPLLIEAIKDLQKQIDELKSK
jgi:hypothetical protein